MPDLSCCRIGITFEFGSIDGRFMTVNVDTADQHHTVAPDSNNLGSLEFDVDLPTQIVLKFTGKNSNTDTLVDSDGKVTADVFVKICSLALDGFKLSDKVLYQKLNLVTETQQKITTPYIGFNGTITLDLAQDTVFSQYHLLNS